MQAGKPALFEVLMRRHNQRLYRTARAVVRNEAEVEDVMPQPDINAFTHLHQFEQRSQLSTWLTRITLNEALARRRTMQQLDSVSRSPEECGQNRGAFMGTMRSPQPDPERQVYASELQRVLEEAVVPHGLHAAGRRRVEHQRDG